jgi:hypothetical protein
MRSTVMASMTMGNSAIDRPVSRPSWLLSTLTTQHQQHDDDQHGAESRYGEQAQALQVEAEAEPERDQHREQADAPE